MRIENNLFIPNLETKTNQHKTKEEKHQTTPFYAAKAIKSANAATLAAYSGINFTGKPYDKTNFRKELEERAQISTTKIKIEGKEKELKLYKTKHSEYILNADNNKLYKIRYESDTSRITEQVMASKLYKAIGVRTPEYSAFEKDGKTGYLVEILEEKLEDAETNKKALYKSFVADVWLGNRNGLSKDNTKIDKDGNPVKMSVSGSLDYRASGKLKEDKFDYEIPEINTMRDYSINPDAAKTLSGMEDEELYDAIREFSATYEEKYKEITNICSGYYHPKNGMGRDTQNVLSNRHYNLKDFEKNDKYQKKIKERGLDHIKDNPELSNVRENFEQKDVEKITDEQWQTLKDRDLLKKHSWLKPMSLYEYGFLAEMTDEEHQKALERGLYNIPTPEDAGMYDGIDAPDIQMLSKLTDEEWSNVLKRDLLTGYIKYGHGDFWAYEYITGLSKLKDYEWEQLMLSDYLYSCPKITEVNQFLEFINSDDARELKPSVYERTRMILQSNKQMPKYKRKLDGYRGETVIALASVSNKRWNRIMEITNNFTDVKMGPNSLLDLSKFEDEAYRILQERGMLNEAKTAYGLKDLSNLTEKDWENIDKRGIDKLPEQSYKDWAHLANLSDEEFKLAQDKQLFINRHEGISKYTNYLDGEEIAYIVTSMTDEDWKRFDKRGLLNKYTRFDGLGRSVAGGYEIVKLSKMTDNDFEKFNKLCSTATMYSSTKFDLVQLPEEHFQRLFSRDLFQYINTHEAWDDYTQDFPILSAMAELSDEEYEKFKQLSTSPYKRISSKCLAIKADKLGLNHKNHISELSTKQKHEYLQLLLNKGDDFFYNDFIDNYKGSNLLPKNPEEYAQIIKTLVKSVGIDTREINNTQKIQFLNTLDNISSPQSNLAKLDLKNPNFKLTTEYPRDEFMNDIYKLVKYMDEDERNKVFDYFCFELYTAKDGSIAMAGYPALINNGDKLSTIENPQTKEIIQQIKPYVKRFTQENRVLADGKFIDKDTAQTLNNILEVLPELHTIIGKKQHKTHDYTVDIHTLAVLQECIKNPNFQTLTPEEKQTLVLASLLHDITKEEKEIDKSHPQSGAYDAYFILEKLNLPKEQQNNVYQLIKNHDFLEQCNKPIYDYSIKDKRPLSEDEQIKIIKKYAYELRSGNLGRLEQILTKSDLLSVQRDGSFYKKYGLALEDISKKLDKEIQQVKSTAIPLPQTKIPKASQIKTDGINSVEKTTLDKDGNEIKNKVIYLEKGMDLSKYGFDKGVTTDNFNVLIHGFDNEVQQSILNALDLPDKNALLSSSYVIYSKGNYHAFRQQGFIKDIPADNIGVAYYRDFGSGYKKDTNSLVNNYINGFMYSYRNYLPKLIKEELHLTDEEYIKLYEKIKDKPMDELEKDYPEVAEALKNIFAKMEVHKRKFQRDYNEVLVEKGPTSAIYFVGTDEQGNEYKVEDIPEFLRKYAQDNDLPIIYFGK